MEQKNNIDNNGAWPFHLDHIHPYAYWKGVFSSKECKRIIDICSNYEYTTGLAGLNHKKEVRKSDIIWLSPCDELKWVYERIASIVLSLNERFFKFDIFGMIENLQFTRYQAPDGMYDQHVDSFCCGMVRKLSLTLQLSNPDDYEGGDLNLYFGREPLKMEKQQGYALLFPSYTLHEVTPVTKGTRYSLVSWITGKPFK